jgi:stress-induced morphogen
MFDENIMKEKIEKELEGSEVSVRNPRRDGQHFLVKVVWNGFEGMKLIEQQRKIYQILDEEIKAGIHSLSIKTSSE